MKLHVLERPSEGKVVLGAERDFGRIERLCELDLDPQNVALLRRIALVLEACEGLSDATLRHLASPANTAGTLAERVTAWSIFMHQSRPVALRILRRAREELHRGETA
jgi:hypothetical protein